jgi:hypothetical protein
MLPTVTTTFPVVAPEGTCTAIDESLQLATEAAAMPLNITVLEPWLDPKLDPEIVTRVPTAPDEGDTPVMIGDPEDPEDPEELVTVKLTPLLAVPPTVTTTFPVVAPAGTCAAIDEPVQLTTDVAAVPLNITVLDPWLDPKLDPEIVTHVPTAPDEGDRLVMLGSCCCVAVDGPDETPAQPVRQSTSKIETHVTRATAAGRPGCEFLPGKSLRQNSVVFVSRPMTFMDAPSLAVAKRMRESTNGHGNRVIGSSTSGELPPIAFSGPIQAPLRILDLPDCRTIT